MFGIPQSLLLEYFLGRRELYYGGVVLLLKPGSVYFTVYVKQHSGKGQVSIGNRISTDEKSSCKIRMYIAFEREEIAEYLDINYPKSH
jgi:hypothetical protein